MNSNKNVDFILTSKDIRSFKRLLDEEIIIEFLKWDSCAMLADKYLLATALTYFKRANFTYRQYTPLNLFVALYLAHDMEEDDLDIKNELITFATNDKVNESARQLFFRRKDKLWSMIAYQTTVNRLCCDEIMRKCLPYHNIWKRSRALDHSGVNFPFYLKERVIYEISKKNDDKVDFSVPCLICLINNHLKENSRKAKLEEEKKCELKNSKFTKDTIIIALNNNNNGNERTYIFSKSERNFHEQQQQTHPFELMYKC